MPTPHDEMDKKWHATWSTLVEGGEEPYQPTW